MRDDPERDLILSALRAWVRQRPGLDPRNYISSYRDTDGRRAYQGEARRIGQQLRDAEELIRAVEWRRTITSGELVTALDRAFSGRLTWNPVLSRLDYCTGQYWPTEYRAAACAVLSRALWTYWRDDAAPIGKETVRDAIMRSAKANLPRGVFNRWFRDA